jgi:hypothetical protein
MTMRLPTRLVREPLLHFAVFGGLIFLLYAAVAVPRPEPTDAIVIGPERIEQLKSRYRSVWRRPPTDDELRTMIDNFVREEIYYREALALGLDRNDTVIRQRLRQKMEFLTDTGADLLVPTKGELEAYLRANEKSFRNEPRIAFEHIYLGEKPSAETIERSLNALQSDPAIDLAALGERTLLPARLGLSPPDAIDGVFGNDFFERLETIPPGVWSGPVASGYGVHLVRILKTSPGSTPSLDEVRDAVLRDWRAAKALELRELHYAKLRQRYTVEVRGASPWKESNR